MDFASSSDAFTLAWTVAVSASLSYWLLYPSSPESSSPSPSASRRAPTQQQEEYFQAVLAAAPAADSWSGKAQGYSWTQTDAEVEVSVPIAEGVRAKDIKCKIMPSTIALTIQGTDVKIEGTLFRRVAHDDCDWSIEKGGDGARAVKLTLVKSVATKDTQNWTSLLRV